MDENVLRSGGRCEYRLHLRHRIPRVDRRCAAVHQRLPGWTGSASWRAEELAAAYGDRFTPPASLVELAAAGGAYE